MSAMPQVLQPAASFDWETLLPVVFFILYGVAQFLGSRKKGGAVEEEGEAPEVDPAERARQIREEIRRKIEERRRAVEGNRSEPERRPAIFPAEPAQPQRSGPSLEQLLEKERQRLEDARRQQREAHQKAMRIEQEAGAFRHKDIRLQAGKEISAFQHQELGVRRKASGKAGNNVLRGQLLADLHSKGGLRKAVLYREILGPPVGLR